MGKEEVLAGLAMEMRRGIIVLCVLARLNEPRYGYHLVDMLAAAGVPVEANTLYPLLRRLEGQGVLQSRWDAQGAAKPRKYYEMTAMGREVLAALQAQWRQTSHSLNALLATDEGGNDHDA